jgi:hypothetical protein
MQDSQYGKRTSRFTTDYNALHPMLSQFIYLYSTRVMNWKDLEGNGCGIIEVLPRKSSGRTEKNRKNLNDGPGQDPNSTHPGI